MTNILSIIDTEDGYMEKEQLKEFVTGIMEELELSGGKNRKLIERVATQHDYDRKRTIVFTKRALIGL